MKILIIRFSSIGDIVLTTPVVRCLKTQIDNCEIHYASKIGFRSFLEPNPNIDKVHLLADNEKEFIDSLKKESFDYIIDLHHNIRTLRIKKALGVKSFSFDKVNLKKALLVNFKIDLMPDLHIVDRYMQTVSKLGVENDNKGLDYFIPEKDIVDVAQFPFQSSFNSYVIGGQHQTKKMPVNKMIDLCNKLNKPMVLLGGKEDEQDALQIISGVSNPKLLYNQVGKINLNQSASVVQQSQTVYTHDTGMMHIAAAFKKKDRCNMGEHGARIWYVSLPDRIYQPRSKRIKL